MPGRQGQEPRLLTEGQRQVAQVGPIWPLGLGCPSASSEARSWVKTPLMLGTDMCLLAQQSGSQWKGAGLGHQPLSQVARSWDHALSTLHQDLGSVSLSTPSLSGLNSKFPLQQGISLPCQSPPHLPLTLWGRCP